MKKPYCQCDYEIRNNLEVTKHCLVPCPTEERLSDESKTTFISKNQLQVAIYCKQIVDTKWYQFRKRKKLYNKACEFAKINNINFPIKQKSEDCIQKR